ncbi:MAG TPA: DnaD domain protein, partial [Anaerolineaceae bacterium]|nr:DnaD domain protein [Anaerolineaceae bacterium]
MKRPGLSSFSGFPAGRVRLTPVPAPFFTDLLPEVDNLNELKIILYALWYLDRLDGAIRFLRRSDLRRDQRLMAGLAERPEDADRALDDALERACLRRVLLKAAPPNRTDLESLYFLNSPRGRAAANALEKGAWRVDEGEHPEISLEVERPNVFLLYEQNIGPLTPMIAETLRDAERLYPADWIEEAIRIAVQKNVRNWRYVEAILRSWK